MNVLKTLPILTLGLLMGCQQAASSAAPITVLNAPASNDVQSLDLSKLPDGFPVLAEIVLPNKPAKCGLAKSNRPSEAKAGAQEAYDNHFVFVFHDVDETTGDPIHHVGINGELRKVKPSGSADRGTKIIRYFETIDGPKLEFMVALEPGDGVNQSTGTLGRVKAWDGDTPLMCAYNMVQVAGDCEL